MYKVLASTRMDMNEGWVWVTNENFAPRSVVKIKNSKNSKKVYCECLKIDENFRYEYNQSPRIHIQENEKTMVMNAWFREKLGGVSTNEYHDLQISQANCVYGKIRASLSHPQIIVRLASYLASISIILGLISIFLGLF